MASGPSSCFLVRPLSWDRVLKFTKLEFSSVYTRFLDFRSWSSVRLSRHRFSYVFFSRRCCDSQQRPPSHRSMRSSILRPIATRYRSANRLLTAAPSRGSSTSVFTVFCLCSIATHAPHWAPVVTWFSNCSLPWRRVNGF